MTSKPPPYDDAPPSYSSLQNENEPSNSAPPPSYPPPPGIHHASSTGANASANEADQASMWCRFYPLTAPFPLPPQQVRTIHAQDHTLLTPENFRGTKKLVNPASSTWRVSTPSKQTDVAVQTTLPLYSQPVDSPMFTERSKTIYFELRILTLGSAAGSSRFSAFKKAEEEAGVAIGFFAPPYPPFRLPGWQRGSLAIHSDDGRRYVGNDQGGVDFTTPFKVGETIGLGMTFEVGMGSGKGPEMNVEVFFTRDGKKAGGWNLLNDTDAEWESVEGLRGEHDIFACVGLFGPAEVELNFGEQAWMYRGWSSSAA